MTAPDFSRLTALVVDDDEFSRNLLEHVLTGLGLATVLGANGRETAISALRQHKPDIVFLDIHMPQVDGWTLLDEVRALRPQLKIVMVTGSNLPSDFSTSLEKRIDGYCIKPVLPDVMQKIISKVFGHGGG